MSFRRTNLFELPLEPQTAHAGVGVIAATRIATAADVDGACNFIDFAELPPGTSIGDHQHGVDSEEYYLVLSGRGRMRLGDHQFDVAAGDLVRNEPGGTHGLANVGEDALKLFIFEIEPRRP